MALEGTVAFTGRLASMRRADAFALVRTHGGKPREGVTKRTDVLIVGEFGWPLLDDGRPSNSLARAKSYRVLIASERQFLQWLGKSAPEEQAKTYSADQLASLSKLPKEIVDQLSMFGLIEARNGLRFISRNFDGFGPPDEFTEQQRFESIDNWKKWYKSIRPTAVLEK